MKFLCVPCDTPMKLQTVAPPDRGSLSVVYSCPECGYEMAMLTNPFETQLVQSLGVRIGPDSGGATGAGTAVRSPGGPGVESGTSAPSGKCPFPAMVGGIGEVLSETSPGEVLPVRWTSAAEARLANIPSFVRPMAKTGIEKFAREKGAVEVDEMLLDQA